MNSMPPEGQDPGEVTRVGGQRPIPLAYVRELPDLSPPMTRWQGVAVVLFLLSFPFLLVMLWLLTVE